jgi:hypothetical protein
MTHRIAVVEGKPAMMFIGGVACQRLKYIKELTNQKGTAANRPTENPHAK